MPRTGIAWGTLGPMLENAARRRLRGVALGWRLCRYIMRSAISETQLSISPQGRVRYQLKTRWRNGGESLHLVFRKFTISRRKIDGD